MTYFLAFGSPTTCHIHEDLVKNLRTLIALAKLLQREAPGSEEELLNRVFIAFLVPANQAHSVKELIKHVDFAKEAPEAVLNEIHYRELHKLDERIALVEVPLRIFIHDCFEEVLSGEIPIELAAEEIAKRIEFVDTLVRGSLR